MKKKWFKLLAAFSGLSVIVVGALLAVQAPSLLIEYTYGNRGVGYSIKYITYSPILPTIIVFLGILTFALALREYRHLLLLTSLCLSLIITSLTSTYFNAHVAHAAKFGYPLGWLVWIIPSFPQAEPQIMGVIALPFLIDLVLWSLIVWAVMFLISRIIAPQKKVLKAVNSKPSNRFLRHNINS